MAPRDEEDATTPRWTRYKLQGDPYFVDALEPDEDALYPITLFRGRDEELDTIESLIRDNDRSATLVHAQGGYGKTTLANRVAHDVAEASVLVPPEEIQLSAEDASFLFFRDLLSGILAAVVDAGHSLPGPPADPQDDPDTEFPALLEARILVRTVRRRSGLKGGGQVLGTGVQAGIENAYLKPSYEPGASRHLLSRVAREVAGLGCDGILVRVNNLDNIASNHPEVFEAFLGVSRDLFKVPGIHYLLLGDQQALSNIEGTPRVRGVFDLPIELEPFGEEQVLEILQARYEHLATAEDWTPPAGDDLIRRLHRVHYGDLRNILTDLGRSIQAVRNIEAGPVTVEDALPVLQDLYLDSLSQRLGDEHWETIELMTDKKGPVRQVDLLDELELSPGAVNMRFQKLEKAGAIEISHRDGASKYFRLTSAARFALAGKRRRKSGPGGVGSHAVGSAAVGSGEAGPPEVPGQLKDAYLEGD